MLSTDAFLRFEAVIYFRLMTLHFTQTYNSLWFPFVKPCLLGLAVPQHFLPLRYSPFFTLSFCLLIGKSLLTSPLIYPTTISPLNHIKSVISSVFPNFHFKTTLNTDSVITGKAGNKRFSTGKMGVDVYICRFWTVRMRRYLANAPHSVRKCA